MKVVPVRERRKLLRTFRRQFNVTLEELGKLSGLSKSMLSRFEASDRDLSPAAWSRVAQTIGSFVKGGASAGAREITRAGKIASKLNLDRKLLLQRFTSSAVYLSDPKLSPEQGAALQLKAWEGEFTSEEWRQIAWEWSRVFHREWSGASVLEIAAETGIPKKRLYRYEAREIELTVEEIEKWQSAIDNARKKNLAFVRDPSDTSDRGFDEVMTAIAAGHRAALCGIQARYRNRFRGTWGKLPAQSEPPVLGMKRGVLEHRKDLLARLENAGALTDPSLVGEIKETLRRDIQALEADLPAE